MFDSLDDIKLILEEDMGSEGNMNFDPLEDLDFLNDDLFTDPVPKLAPSSVSTPSFGSSSFSLANRNSESSANATFDFKNKNSLANATFNFNGEFSRLPKSAAGPFSRQRKQNQETMLQRSMSTSSVRNNRAFDGNDFAPSSNATFETKTNNPVASFLQRQNQLKEQRGHSAMAKSYSTNSVRKRNFGTIDEHKPNATFDDHEPPMSRNSIASFLKAKQSGPAMGRSFSTSLIKPTSQVHQRSEQTSNTLNAILSTHNLKKPRMGSTEMNAGGNANFDVNMSSRSSTNPFMKTLSQGNSQALSSSKSSNPFMQQMGRLQTGTMKSSFAFERDDNEGSNRREEDIEGPMDAALLHSSCKLYHDNLAVVESALGLDPSSVRRSIPTFCSRPSNSLWRRSGKEGKYCYPLNIALYFQASLDIIRVLANAGSDVLAFNDGPDGAGSLAIAIACHSASWPVVQLLLATNPMTASVADRLGNYPLHRILQTMPTEQTVTAIYEAYPEALSQRNFHGKTPLDLAVHNVTCPEAVVNALQRKSYSRMERNAQHL